MAELRQADRNDLEQAMAMIRAAKANLKAQGIDQWQNGYPDEACIRKDIESGKGYMLVEKGECMGYLCAAYDGEPAYDHLNGEWMSTEPYVVVHRMAFSDAARGKGLSYEAFRLVEEMSSARGIHNFRVDTDEDNSRMKHILDKCGFTYRGTSWFDNSEKIAYDKGI